MDRIQGSVDPDDIACGKLIIGSRESITYCRFQRPRPWSPLSEKEVVDARQSIAKECGFSDIHTGPFHLPGYVPHPKDAITQSQSFIPPTLQDPRMRSKNFTAPRRDHYTDLLSMNALTLPAISKSTAVATSSDKKEDYAATQLSRAATVSVSTRPQRISNPDSPLSKPTSHTPPLRSRSQASETPWWRRLQAHAKAASTSSDNASPCGPALHAQSLRGEVHAGVNSVMTATRRRAAMARSPPAPSPYTIENLFGPSPLYTSPLSPPCDATVRPSTTASPSTHTRGPCHDDVSPDDSGRVSSADLTMSMSLPSSSLSSVFSVNGKHVLSPSFPLSASHSATNSLTSIPSRSALTRTSTLSATDFLDAISTAGATTSAITGAATGTLQEPLPSASELLARTSTVALTPLQLASIPPTWRKAGNARVWRRQNSFLPTQYAVVNSSSPVETAGGSSGGTRGARSSGRKGEGCVVVPALQVPAAAVDTHDGSAVRMGDTALFLPTEVVTSADDATALSTTSVLAHTDVPLPPSLPAAKDASTASRAASSSISRTVTTASSRRAARAHAQSGQKGFEPSRDMASAVAATGYSRRELYTLWLRYRVLCGLSGLSQAMSCDMLQHGVPRLAAEDDMLLARVCHLVDEDRSGSIEWEEFLQTVTALENGSVEAQCRFLVQCYDVDGDGAVGKDDLRVMFRHSSMLFIKEYQDTQKLKRELLSLAHGFFRLSDKPKLEAYRREVEEFVAQVVMAQTPLELEANKTAEDVVTAFVNDTFKLFGKESDDSTITAEELVQHVKRQGSKTDVWALFGRSVVDVL